MRRCDINTSEVISIMIENSESNSIKKLKTDNNLKFLNYFWGKYEKHILLGKLDYINTWKSNKYHDITKYDLLKYYDIIRDNKKIRPLIYDEIMAQNPTCPICNVSTATTLDHYLPKDTYSWFSILPINLIPMCGNCNNKKGEDIRSELYFHPYFHDVNNISFVSCKLDESLENLNKPLKFIYYISNKKQDNNLHISRQDYKLILLSQAVYKLTEIYRINSLNFLSQYIFDIYKNFNISEKEKIRNYLTGEISDLKGKPNWSSWKVELLKALRNSEWFLDVYLVNLKDNYKNIYS